nr:DUF2971 domain-containing protein [uncultured Cohaesibacter sp.]
MMKITPMSDTNDDFEVRKTFSKISGPRFHEFMAPKLNERVNRDIVGRNILEKCAQRLGRPLNRHEKRSAISKSIGGRKHRKFITNVSEEWGNFVEYSNSQDAIDLFLKEWGNELLCLSFSDRWDIPNMWTFYAGCGTGFVIEFTTEHNWFANRVDGSKSRLHQVRYFDGILDEPIQDLEAAFSSKLSCWSYEREWRIYFGHEDVEKTNPNNIHLVSFPRDAVSSIIVGAKSTLDMRNMIKRIVSAHYPSAKIFIATPNKKTSSYDLTGI